MISDIENLILKLTEKINNGVGRVVGIDGYDDAGKTFLGNRISELLNIKHIDLDNDSYLIKNRGNFVDSIKDRKLTEDIQLYTKDGNVVVSGICLMEILTRNYIRPDILIYVKRYDRHGMYWQDEDDCTFTGDPTERIMEKLKAWENTPLHKDNTGNEKDHRYRADIMSYHQKYKPHEKADIIFQRIEN